MSVSVLIVLGILINTASASIGSSNNNLEDHIGNFVKTYAKYYEICKLSNNTVAQRGDKFAKGETDPTVSNWSLNFGLLHSHLDVQQSVVGSATASGATNVRVHSLPVCQTSEAVSQSLRNSVSIAGVSSRPLCRLHWFSGAALCNLMRNHAYVIFIGDSLARHAHMGFRIILSRNWQFGGFPAEPGSEVLSKCSCDGQFSEAAFCRIHDHFEEAHIISHLHEQGVCTHLSREKVHTQVLYKENLRKPVRNIIPGTCKQLNGKPVQLFFSAGAHFQYDFRKTMDGIINPQLKKIYSEFEGCEHLIHVVLLGVPACSDRLVHLYPVQSAERAIAFNNELEQYFRQESPLDATFGLFNITNSSQDGRTSDGMHSLSDVNMLQAVALLNIMHIRLDVAGTGY